MTELDESPLAGRWRNADDDAVAPAIRTAELRRIGERLDLGMVGVDGFDWGWAPVEQVFAGGPASSVAVGVTASFEVGDRRARVHGNIKLGVMVLAAFVQLPGPEQRIFTRDFLFGDQS